MDLVVQNIKSGDFERVQKAFCYIIDVLIKNEDVELVFQDLSLLEAIFDICSEDQVNEDLISSALDVIQTLLIRVHTHLLRFSDSEMCRFKQGLSGTSVDTKSFQNTAKNYAFVVLSKMSRLCLRETSIFEKALRITLRVNKMLTVCFTPIYDLESVNMEREDGDEVKRMLSQFTEVLQIIRTEVASCEELDAVRLFRRYYMLTLVLCQVLQTTLTEFGTMLVPPAELGEEFSLILLNEGFKAKHPQQWEYIETFMKTYNDDLATQCSELMSIASLFQGMAKMKFRGTELPADEMLALAKENLMVYNFEVESVSSSIDTVINTLVGKLESNAQFVKARSLVLKIMAHPLPNIKEKCYICLRGMLQRSLGLDAMVKEKVQDLNTVKFLVGDEILQEIFYGFQDESEIVQKASEEMFVFLMKGASVLDKSLQKSLLDAILSPDHPLEYHIVQHEGIQKNFFIYLVGALGDPEKVLPRLIRFFFSNDEQLRELAMAHFVETLENTKDAPDILRFIEDPHIDLPALILETERSAVKYRALLTAEFNIETMEECMVRLSDSKLSIADARADVNELNLLLDSPSLQKVFIARDGLTLLVSFLTKASNQCCEEVLHPVLLTLLNFYVGYATCRTELLKAPGLALTLLKVVILLRHNTVAKKISVQFLCLVVYAVNLQVFVAENQEVNMDDNVSIFTPSYANRAVSFPFEVTFFSVESKHKDLDLVLPHEVTRYFLEDFQNFSLLRISWNLGRYSTVEQVTESFDPEEKGDFQLAPLEFWRLRALEISKPIMKDLELIRATETHDEFSSTLSSLSLAVEHARISDLKDLKVPWVESFEKFLNVSPVSDEDRLLMRDVLRFFARVIFTFDDNQLSIWIIQQFLSDTSVVMVTTEDLCNSLKDSEDVEPTIFGTLKSVFAMVDVICAKDRSSDGLGALLTLVGWTLHESANCDQVFISSLLKCFNSLLLSSATTPELLPVNLLESVANSCLHLVDRFRNQKYILMEIAVLLTKLSKREKVAGIVLKDPSWILVCISMEDRSLRAAAITLLTTVIVDKKSVGRIDDIVKGTLPGGLLVLSLTYMFDFEECCLVRRQATVLACTLVKHIDSATVFSEVEKFAPVDKLYRIIGHYCPFSVIPKDWTKEAVVTSDLLTWVFRFYSSNLTCHKNLVEDFKKTGIQEDVLGLLNSTQIDSRLAAEALNFHRKLASCKAEGNSNENLGGSIPPSDVASKSGSRDALTILETITKPNTSLPAQRNGLISLSLAINSLTENKFTEFIRLFERRYSAQMIDVLKVCSVTGGKDCVLFFSELIRSRKTCVNSEFEVAAAEILARCLKEYKGEEGAVRTLARLMTFSDGARSVALKLGVDDTLGEQMLDAMANRKDGLNSKAKRLWKMEQYSQLIAAIHSLCVHRPDAKKRVCSSCKICYVMVADWAVFSSNDGLLVSLLRFLTSLSHGNEEAFGVLLTTVPAMKRSLTLQNALIDLILKYYSDIFRRCVKNQKADPALWRSLNDLLCAAVLTTEGRSSIIKSNVTALFVAALSSRSLSVNSSGIFMRSWLNICLNLSMFENGATLMYNEPDFVVLLLNFSVRGDIPNEDRNKCLEVFRNVCLGHLKPKLAVKSDILPKLCSLLSEGAPALRRNATVAVWSLCANSEKAKSLCRAYLHNWSVGEEAGSEEVCLRRILAL